MTAEQGVRQVCIHGRGVLLVFARSSSSASLVHKCPACACTGVKRRRAHRWVLWPERNARIHYVTRGESGPRLLLVHGFGVGEYHFERNVADLARDHRVWAVDLLGQGASWPLGPVDRGAGLQYSLDTWTAQLAFFVREVIYDAGAVYVAGNSLGGLLAVSLAHTHPEVREQLICTVLYSWFAFLRR